VFSRYAIFTSVNVYFEYVHADFDTVFRNKYELTYAVLTMPLDSLNILTTSSNVPFTVFN